MSFEAPEPLYYAATHEWLRLEDDEATVGITDFAQDELGDIIFVELPAVGDEFGQGDEFGIIESMKADASLYAPVGGTVEAVHEDVTDHPGLVNDDPYGEGWLIRLKVIDDGELDDLLSVDEYRDRTA